MREEVIEFLVGETSYTYEELNSKSDKELDDIMGRYFSVEY
jgi:hypothetical protein